ncbi:MAG: hypothetical protein ACQEP1_03580 [Nanobdellota archaeon]
MNKAKRYLHTADHILTQTYPMVNDPRLLLSAIDNVRSAMIEAVSGLLERKREKKEIPPYHDQEQSKVNMFKLRIVDDYGIDDSLLDEVIDLINKHKESPVEFPREDKFVICDEDYNNEALTPDYVKGLIKKADEFVDEVMSK